MRNFCIIGVVVCLFFGASCSDHKNSFGEFPETVTVVTRAHDFEGVFMKYPYRVRLFDSSLYVMDLHGDDYYCHELAYPSLKYIRSFAKRGKGPGELTGMGNMLVNDKGTVYVLKDYGGAVYTLEEKTGRINPIVELPKEIAYYPDFALYSDSVFIFPDYYGRSRLFFVDGHGKIIRTLGSIPVTEKGGDMPDAFWGSAWRAFIGYNPHNGVAALVTQLGEVLEIYNLRNGQSKVVTGPGGEPKCKVGKHGASPIGIMGYGDVFVGESYIYALFWGHEFDKIRRNEITVEGGKYIHVFDLEGKPVRRYELDRHITGFYVNEVSGEVIGTDVNEEQLVSFSI